MNFSFHPSAEQELDDSIRYYEECRTGLGMEFAEEIYAAIARIIAYPNAWTLLSKNSRRCLVNRFPYGVIFQVAEPEIRIIAIAELHRLPGYWQNRV